MIPYQKGTLVNFYYFQVKTSYWSKYNSEFLLVLVYRASYTCVRGTYRYGAEWLSLGWGIKEEGGEENKTHLIWECIQKSRIPKTLSHAFSFQSRAKDSGSSGPGKGIAQDVPRRIRSLCRRKATAGAQQVEVPCDGVSWGCHSAFHRGSHTYSQHPHCLQMWTLKRGVMVRNWVSVEKRNKGRGRKRKANSPCWISYYYFLKK